jgi:hypothetical protein
MHVNTKASEFIAVLSSIAPASYLVAGPPATVWIKADQFHEYLVALGLGAITGGGTAKLQQANTSGGGGAKDIPGKAASTIAGADANKQLMINLRPEEMDSDSGFAWFGLVMTITGTSAFVSGSILGINPKLGPANTYNNAAVKEIIY